jgi:acetyltransferase-like isoleucine patch superfamily enzyme
MINLIIKIIKYLLNRYNHLLIHKYGINNQIFSRIDRRHPDSRIIIGSNNLLNGRLVCESPNSKIIINNNVFIGGGTIIDCLDEVEILDDVLISYQCLIVDHDSHSTELNLRKNDLQNFKKGQMNWSYVKSKKVKISKGAWICAKSIILKGVNIGEGAIVGAGSVVTKDVSPFTLVSGSPAVFRRCLKNEKT